MDDANKGLFHLQNTHILPINADLSSVLGGIKAAPVKIHNFHSQFDRKAVAPYVFNANIDYNEELKLPTKNLQNNDISPVVRRPLSQIPITLNDLDLNSSNITTTLATKNIYEQSNDPTGEINLQVSSVSNEVDEENFDDDESNKIRSYDELLDTYSLHLFVIRKGRALTTTPEYVSFRRKYAYMWGSVKKIVMHVYILNFLDFNL